MTRDTPSASGGILIHAQDEAGLAAARRDFLAFLASLELDPQVEAHQEGLALRFHLKPDVAQEWAPDFDTTRLCQRLNLDTGAHVADLEREILVAMLVGPVAFEFPSFAEARSAIHIRRNIVLAARRTALDFHTTEAERPEDYWTYVEGKGFTILPGRSLIEGLVKATQPEVSGQLYAFSCYRATEYVILLGLAQELAASNPELLARLQRQWENRPIMSGQFHDVFLHEYGSMEAPLPPTYYVPGDRLWFRNPDERSADVTGYEGSWVFYLGGGLFTNFWKRDQPFSLTAKCLEIYHWRHGAYVDEPGRDADGREPSSRNGSAPRRTILQRWRASCSACCGCAIPRGSIRKGAASTPRGNIPAASIPAPPISACPNSHSNSGRSLCACCAPGPVSGSRSASACHSSRPHTMLRPRISVAEEFRQACSAEQQQLVRIEADMATYLDTWGIRHK